MLRKYLVPIAALLSSLLVSPAAAQFNPFNPDQSFCNTRGAIATRLATRWQCLTPGASGQVLVSNGAGADIGWLTLSGTGTVTSVAISGGTTGLTTSGGPITTSGTITLAGTLAATNGGTGQTTYAVGDILIGGASNTLAKLSASTSGLALRSNGAGVAPSYGIVGVNGGGTGFATYTVGDILYADTTTSLAKLASAAAGRPLVAGGAGVAPSYAASLGAAFGGTGQTSYTVGDLLYANTTTSLAKISPSATPGVPIISNGTGNFPVYGTVSTAGGGTGQTTAATGDILLGNAGSWSRLAVSPTNGHILTSNGTTAVWSPPTAAVNTAPTVTTYTTGSGTHTTAAGALYLIIEMTGGGPGGGTWSGSGGVQPGNGGNTTFGTLTANGGTIGTNPGAGSGNGPACVTVPTATNGDINYSGDAPKTGASGAQMPGFSSGVFSTFPVRNFVTPPLEAGLPGGPAYDGTSNMGGGMGCTGAALRKVIPSPAASYSYSVGGGGAAGVCPSGTNCSTSGGRQATAGTSGYIRVYTHFQ